MIEVNLSDTVYLACRARLFSTLLLLVYASMAQANTLGITSAVMNADGTAVLAVPSTVSGAAPAGLEWTIVYSPNQISSMVITPGPATAGASKTLSCVSSSGGATCIVAGLNRNPIGSGVVAYLNTTVVQGQTSASIQISNLYATDPDGNGSIVTSAGGGQITSYGLLPVTCSPTHLTPGGVSNCTVSLTQAAPAGGATVTLASNNTSVTVPASITLAAGAATANFSATALTTFTGNQSATVTATLGSSSQTVVIGSAGGTPVFIQEKDNQVTSGLSASTAFSSSAAAGNLIAVFVIWDNTSNASISDTLGNTYTAAVAPTRWNSTRSIQTFYAINRAGGSDTVTATFGSAISSFGIIYAHEYSGVRTTSPIDVTAAAAGLSRSLDSGSALTTNNTDLLFAGGVSANVVTAAGSGYTARSTFQGNITEDQIVLTTGSYNATATQSTGAWATQMVAFKGALDTSLPTVPIGLSVTGVSTSTVSLSWVASTDPDDASNQLSYALYRNGSLLGVTTPGVTSFNDSGLAAAVTYTYTISASDPAGNASTQSAGISATTNSLAPVLVTGVACNPGNVISGASATCVITLSRIVSADTLILLTSSSVLLSTPASIKVSAGNQIGSAILTAGIVPKNIQAVVSAALGTSLQSTTVLLWPTPTLSS
ncbi:MAG TPA: fibronectin type III domain-containing protein, partial [Bryobacteraceae bacterium]|nr:fibronectin type III domain-containing protein [Bryobacteraceae bacterium]